MPDLRSAYSGDLVFEAFILDGFLKLTSCSRAAYWDFFGYCFRVEYPGQNYVFNWCLNGDGVTPTKKSAFRITKSLDLKIAGLQPAMSPLKVRLELFLCGKAAYKFVAQD